MGARTKLVAPLEVEPRAEHPHRCKAGHRWQHGGPAATTCRIPSYDPISGDLPFVGPEDCPVCSGRSDLLIREPHSHYCNICDGDWSHEGHCLDSLAACCPWCFPKPDAEPLPGARSGPHFHVCAECGQNWRHATGCSAPLRAALSECPGCRSASPPTGRDVQTRAPSPATPSTGARAIGARIGARVRLPARSIGIAAAVLLSIAVVLKGYTMLRSPDADDSAPVRKPRIEAPSPAPDLPPPAPEPAPLAPASDLPKPPAKSSSVKSIPSAKPFPPAKPIAPAKPIPPSTVADLPAPRAPVGDRVIEPRAQESRPDEPAKPAPFVARPAVVAETPPPAPETPPTPSESGPPTPVRAALPSIPGAPPFAGLSGSSGLGTSLDGHPRRAPR